MLRGVFVVALLSLMLTQGSEAQFVDGWGVKTGLSLGWGMEKFGGLTYTTDPRYGFALGGSVQTFKTPIFVLITELMYFQRGHTLTSHPEDGGADATITFTRDYLSVPILLALHSADDHFNVFAGPRVDFLLESGDLVMPESVDLGATFGIGGTISAFTGPRVSLEARYSPSFTNYYEGPYSTSQNSALEFLVGLVF
jgi:hypothetical protein